MTTAEPATSALYAAAAGIAEPDIHVSGIVADLVAVLVAVTAGEPRVLTLQDARALPSGPFELTHRSLQSGLRAWVERQTHHPVGYVEQLYTFADRDRGLAPDQRVISVSYLGLTREQPRVAGEATGWQDWYNYLPWEDRRIGVPPMVDGVILPALRAFAKSAATPAVRQDRANRIAVTFGTDGRPWNEELVLQRYELLFEAGLIPEARRGTPAAGSAPVQGRSMILDHRRILATGIARLRAKIKYHPVVFELMPDTFTLLQLQRCVEALAGRLVHKQNFRRLVEQQELVEETGQLSQETGGRPAKLFRFRRDVLFERAIVGTKLPISRS
ncbi:MAG: NUDIX hydrolase [Methylovirgula sp.]